MRLPGLYGIEVEVEVELSQRVRRVVVVGRRLMGGEPVSSRIQVRLDVVFYTLLRAVLSLVARGRRRLGPSPPDRWVAAESITSREVSILASQVKRP